MSFSLGMIISILNTNSVTKELKILFFLAAGCRTAQMSDGFDSTTVVIPTFPFISYQTIPDQCTLFQTVGRC